MVTVLNCHRTVFIQMANFMFVNFSSMEKLNARHTCLKKKSKYDNTGGAPREALHLVNTQQVAGYHPGCWSPVAVGPTSIWVIQ